MFRATETEGTVYYNSLSQRRQITILAHITRDETMSSSDFPQILQSWPTQKHLNLLCRRSLILISSFLSFSPPTLASPVTSLLSHTLSDA